MDFICPICKSKIKTKPWGRNYIEVKCLCDEKDIRTDNTDDAIKQFLRKRKPRQIPLFLGLDNEKHTINNKLSQLRSELLNNLSNHSDRSSKYPLFHMSTIENLQSILSAGILSHDLSEEKKPIRISNPDIVKNRGKIFPSPEYSLHHYANFYFRIDNAMLYERVKFGHEHGIITKNIIVFELNLDLNQKGIFVSDGNCASYITRIEPIPAHDIFESIDKMKKISFYGKDDELKRRFQAECLIPEKVPVSSIHTIHVQNDMILKKINDIIQEKFPNLSNIKVEINLSMFNF